MTVKSVSGIRIPVDEPTKFTTLLAFDSNGLLIYIGKAAPGSSQSSGVWRIVRLEYDSNSNLTGMKWAVGSDNFTNVWDNRTGLSYS